MTGPREHLLWGFSIIFLWFALAEGQYGIPQAFPNFGKWCQPLNSTELRECEQQIAAYPKKQVWDQESELQWLYSTVYEYGLEDRARQGPLCDLLLRNDDIIRNYCSGATSPTSLEMVKYELSQMLTYTNLDKFNTSELRLVFNSIVETVEASLLVTFFKSPQNTNVNTSELEIHMKVARDVCVGEARSLILSDSANTMEVPCTHVRGETSGAILVSYLGLGFRVDGKLPGVLGKDREEIISGIVSGAITNPITEDLDPPVTFYLEHQKEVPSTFTVQCVFWDKEQRAWSSRGCKTMKSDRDEITLCVCNHLSTFAVLMAPSDIQEDHGLVVISWIGLILSLLCLCLSLLTFILCRSLRNAHTSVLTALCGCLFVGQLLVLTGLHLTGNKVLCAVIAGLLQFSFLCAFCWMSLESALLFMTVRNLQAMNYMTSKRSHFPYICLAGFGIPAIIIAISAAIRPDGYGTDKYCWLKLDLIWSFLGPVCLFITINFILLVLTFVLLRKKLSSLNANVSTLKNTRLLTFKALSQLFILGCTWIFGIFQFGSGSLVMSYIFTILNSLQGLYIFCVHCLLNRQVREEYVKGFRRLHAMKSDSEATSSSAVPMMVKSSQTSEAPK